MANSGSILGSKSLFPPYSAGNYSKPKSGSYYYSPAPKEIKASFTLVPY